MLKLHRVTTPYEKSKRKKLLTILTSWLPWSVNCYFYCLRISSNLRRWSWNCYSYCKAFTYSPEKKRERNRKIINKFCLWTFQLFFVKDSSVLVDERKEIIQMRCNIDKFASIIYRHYSFEFYFYFTKC
jgi:hypothetical protein